MEEGNISFMPKDFAVIRTGGKQYRVHEGMRLKVEKLLEEEGAEVSFEEVLLTKKGDAVSVGKPFVEGASVKGKVLEQGKHAKQIVFKMRPDRKSVV